MPYPEAHNLLTVHWYTPNVPDETGQFGLRFQSATAATAGDLAAIAGDVSAMWSAATSAIASAHSLLFLRAARIGTNGLYVPGTVAVDYTYPTPVQGASTGGVYNVLQTAMVMSLLTAMPRGIAHAGRVYRPPLNVAPDGNFRWALASVSSACNTFSAMLSALDGSALGQLAVMSKGTPAVPAGAINLVTGVKADTKPDTQRRRAKQLVGAYCPVYTVS
jgi:hypothetical protein